MFVYSLEEGKKRNKKELSKLKHEITCLPNFSFKTLKLKIFRN